MSKLTKAQLEALRDNEVLSVSTISQNVWGRKGGFSVKVRRSTFDALRKAGMYSATGGTTMTTFYAITDAGRAALAEPSP